MRPIRYSTSSVNPQQPDALPPQAAQPTASSTHRRHTRIAVLTAFGLTALAATLAISATTQWSLTYDEPAHITFGYGDYKTRDFRLADHPPLAHYLMALPMLPLDLASPFDGPKWDLGDGYALADRFFSSPNDAERIALRARIMIVAVWLAGGWIVWAWARRLFGDAGALLSMTLYLFFPDMMAHGSLATTDVPAVVAMLAALFTLARLVECLTVGRALLFALAVSAVVLTKYSGLLLAPVFVIVAIVAVVRRRPTNAFAFCGVAGAALVLSVTAIWAAYGFRYRAALDPPTESSYSHMLVHGHTRDPRLNLSDEERSFLIDRYGRDDLSLIEQLTSDHPVMRVVLSAADEAHLLPEAYVYGLALTVRRADQRSAFLLGETSVEGWWYYFPVAALLKTPVAVLAMAVLAAIAYRRRGGAEPPAHRESAAFMPSTVLVIVVFEGVFWLTSMAAHLNIGHRHLLPVYPPLFVLCGAAGAWLRSPRGLVRALPAVCAIAVIATSALAWPHQLGYFSELVGGSRNGARYLSDSNIDWGQDLIHLRRYLDAHADERPRERIKLTYFGTADPAWYDLGDVSMFKFENPDANDNPRAEFTAGTYVISLTTLHGAYLKPEFQRWSDELQRLLERHERALHSLDAGDPTAESLPFGLTPETLAAQCDQLRFIKLLSKLRARPPDAIVGSSLFVYDLDTAALDSLLNWRAQEYESPARG